MSAPRVLRALARRAAPKLMADRDRRYERAYRERAGITAIAHAIAGDRRVSGGPFVGLQLRDPLAEIDVPAAKLIGSYEQEIADVFSAAVAAGPPTFVDVGCADGYYAVGMAHASPSTTTYAFDLAASARRVCRETAQANAVAERVHIAGRCDARALRRLPLKDALVLIDIEGAEVDFLNSEAVELLASAQVVVEVHEDDIPGAGDRLRTRFAATHTAAVVTQVPRTASEYPQLAELSDERARLAIAEHRGPALHWLVLTPR